MAADVLALYGRSLALREELEDMMCEVAGCMHAALMEELPGEWEDAGEIDFILRTDASGPSGEVFLTAELHGNRKDAWLLSARTGAMVLAYGRGGTPRKAAKSLLENIESGSARDRANLGSSAWLCRDAASIILSWVRGA